MITSRVIDRTRGFARIGAMNTPANAFVAPSIVQPASGSTRRSVGELLREWRLRRRMSQMLLANEAEISTRHLSFVESGRSLPSREMVMHLAERLDVPLRERNALLVAAGYAPLYRERALDDPQLAAAREAVELVLRGHEPYPALAVDRHWNIVAANAALAPLVGDASPTLPAAPVNALRLSLHPEGVAPRIVNWHAWRAHLLARLQRQIEASADPVLVALHDELAAYPAPPHASAADTEPVQHLIAVPLRIRTALGELSFYSTTTVFGTPVDITLSELAIEAFFPADAQTAQMLRAQSF
ncbi:helix-turn-helix domain-containing protein [Paraburkholderia tagetis]|uniref:Helix-turn-helix domain-containing protein n=1 Tax=Paraburkholderia tagetis TaxID=2913261 RepID=A0A9X1RQV9_9BURK|nr:helix-turn-helix domain-containing protein [Paraburkholderia tagetis]MCG5074247.1 helix-turn-helix domain-containing protein [Paraburkholderia tagetis]